MKRFISIIIVASLASFFTQPAWAESIKMYWADYLADKIQRANLDGSSIEDLITGLEGPYRIDIDLAAGKIYWTHNWPPKIQRANLDGSSIENVITGLDYPYGIALDVAGGKIYWTEPSSEKIQRANLDGTNIEDLVTGVEAYDIALDLHNGKMYWSSGSIQRANLDGSVIETIVTTASMIFGIDIDTVSGKIYYAYLYSYEEGEVVIQRANLNGSSIETLVTLYGYPSIEDIALYLPDGKMYWTVYGGSIQRANLDGSNVEDIVTGLFGPEGVAIPTIPYIDNFEIEPAIGFDSSGKEGGPFTPASKTYTLHNTGPNNISWTASVTQDWLDIGPSSGTLGPNDVNSIQISINSNADVLDYGTYSDELTITNLISGVDRRRSVNLRIYGPTISLSRNEFYFKGVRDVNNPANQVLGISNIGGGVLNWQASETCDWLSVDPNCGSSTSEVDEVNIIVDIVGLAEGIYTCQLTVSSNRAENSPQIVTVELLVMMPEFKLTASDGTSGDYFGNAVDIDGDHCIVGAVFDDDYGFHSGSAYIFKWDGTNWIQQVKLTESDANNRDGYQFGCDVGIDGHRCIVGAWHEEGMAFGSGYAYIYEWNGTQWNEAAQLKASDSHSKDWFGRTVAISGDRCIVGALDHRGDTDHSGAAYIFEFNGAEWIEQAKLLPTDGGQWHLFGLSVDISGDRCIVGTWDNESTYIFEWNGFEWIQKAHLTGLGSDDYFDSVGIDGDRCIIGADLSRVAYIFEWNSTAWTQQAQLTVSHGHSYNFGCSASIKGDRCIVGAKGQYVNGIYKGAAYVFEWNGTNWNEIQIIASDGGYEDCFGYSVGISDRGYIVGSPFDDDNGGNSGSAYVYQSYNLSDLDKNWRVDFYDFAIFSSQWLQAPGIPSADIAPPGGDGFVGYEDFAAFCQNWLD